MEKQEMLLWGRATEAQPCRMTKSQMAKLGRCGHGLKQWEKNVQMARGTDDHDGCCDRWKKSVCWECRKWGQKLQRQIGEVTRGLVCLSKSFVLRAVKHHGNVDFHESYRSEADGLRGACGKRGSPRAEPWNIPSFQSQWKKKSDKKRLTQSS